MRRFWVRILAAVIAAEMIPILVLVAIVALCGPADIPGAEAYANRMGRWVGPIGGSVCAFAASWWAARPTPSRGVRAGLLVGLFLAALDAAILVLARAPFEWIYVASNSCKVLAGLIGGLYAGRTPQARDIAA